MRDLRALAAPLIVILLFGVGMSYSQHQYEVASRRTGVPVALIKLVDSREGSGTSPAGAQGQMQLMPGTARGLERRYKINTRTPMGNLLGGAYYLAEQKRTFGNWRLALAAYNAGPNAVRQYDGVPPYKETQDYVQHIMQQFRKWSGTPGTRAPANITPGSPVSSAVVDPAAFALSSSQDIAQGHYDPIQELQQLHEQMMAASQTLQTKNLPVKPGDQMPGWSPDPHWHKFVRLAPGADRPGVHTSEEVLQFVGQLGSRSKRRLTIGTGSNHNQMTVDGNVSDHWTGHAADIPMSGAALTRLGRRALMQAGMSRKEAMKATGGIYNVGRYQIIFNTNEGGDHWNHLHIGIGG